MTEDDIARFYNTEFDRLWTVTGGNRRVAMVKAIQALMTHAWDEGYEAGSSFNDGLGKYVAPESNPYGPTSIEA